MIAREPVPIELQPKDSELLRHAFWQGMEAKNMELTKWIPKAKHYRDRVSGKVVAVISNVPSLTHNLELFDCQWIPKDVGQWVSGKNLFVATVKGNAVLIEILCDQPTGQKVDDKVTWQPQLFLNGVEQTNGSATLLDTDPVNSNYHNNVLEWDYGICKRRLRIFEGRIRERWLFNKNPNGEIRIRHNQSGDFRLRIGTARTLSEPIPIEVTVLNDDEEVITANALNEAIYPIEVHASATYYPDPNPETSSVDGSVQRYPGAADETWATIRETNGTAAYPDVADIHCHYLHTDPANASKYDNMLRSIFLFDTSGLPDAATISAATLSLRGTSKDDSSVASPPATNIYSSNPASNTALAGTDYDFNDFGTTAFCDTAIAYTSWSTTGYNDFAFNASGIAAISKTGVSKFSARDATYDAPDTEPGYGLGKTVYVMCYSADQADTTTDPKLVVTYTIGLAIPIAMHHYKQLQA